ncbi:MAG: DUF983 domain-containing protein [Acidimicrobiales bacterium]
MGSDEATPAPTVGTLLRRGATKRCPNCGAGDLYRGWFQMAERCPRCGLRFEREPGFFTGAYLINFAITEGFLFVLLMAFMVWKVQRPDAGIAAPLGIGLVLAVVLPVLFYPFARTIWSALDIAMHPIEPDEAADAAAASARPSPTEA